MVAKQTMENKLKDFPKLAKPAQRALANAGISSLKQISAYSEAELMQLHGIGKNAILQIKTALANKGLSLKKN